MRLRIWARSMLGRVGARRLSRVLGLALTTWLLAVSAPAQAAGENLLEGRQPTRVQEVRNARVLTDGVRARDGDEWNTNLTAVFANGRAFVEYDLGRSTSIVAAYLQGDNNDRYIVSVSEDGKRFRELWSAPPHDRPGLQARHSSSLRGSGRYVRISAREGDGAYSLSEVQLFAERPSVFPPELRAESGTALAPRLRTAMLLFGLAFAAFLFLTDRRSRPLWVAAAALAPIAAGYNLYETLADGFPPQSREVSLLRAVSAAIALLALLRQVAFRVRFPANRISYLASLWVSAAIALGCFYNVGHPQFWNHAERRPEFIHTWDMRVYYPFAKYFDELHYDGVYLASVAAYVENVPGTTLESIGHTEIRNMKTHRMQRVEDVKADIVAIKDRFTPERWESFKKDMEFFRQVMGPSYLPTHHDHGSNATPVWVLFAKLVFDWTPASSSVLVFGGLLDLFLLLALFGVMWRTFGITPALLAITVFGANDFYMFGTNWGGATLRHDWLVYLGFGICALRAERWITAGVFFGLSTMIRAFPGAALIGVVIPGLWWLWERYRKKGRLPELRTILERNQAAVRVLVGAAACMVGTFLLSSILLSFDAWVEWWHKIILLNSDVGLNDISLKSLIGGNDWGVVANLRSRRVLYMTAFALSIAAVALACRRRPLDQAAILALPLIPVLTNPANYYAHFIFLMPLLGASIVRARAARKAEAATDLAKAEAPAESESQPSVVVAEVRRDLKVEGEQVHLSTSARVAVATAAAAADDGDDVAVKERREERPSPALETSTESAGEADAAGKAASPRREEAPPRARKSRERARSAAQRLTLPHLAISGPLLAVCVAQYWTVLDPDLERHFQAATALLFAAFGWIYVRILREDGVFDGEAPKADAT